MLRGIVAGLVALALAATPAAAANVSGWYAGIYAGGSSANDVDFGLGVYGGLVDQTGTIETPTSYVNDGGLDPYFFEFLNLGPEEFPFSEFGAGFAMLLDGTLSLLHSGTLGVVVGYGFGNGLRVEGDLSGSMFSSDMFTTLSDSDQEAEGEIDGSGVWTWTNIGDTSYPVDPPFPFDDMGYFYRTDVQFLLLNAFYDIETGSPITPYLGGGLGVARVTSTFGDVCLCGTVTQTRLAPAAQLGGGVRIAISDPLSLDIGYRYKLAADPGFSDLDTFFIGGGAYAGLGVHASGLIGVHTLQAGLTVALP